MPERTPEQICEETLEEFCKDAREKFHNGQEEHGGNLDDRTSFGELKGEAIDFVFYTYTLERQVAELELRLKYYKGLAER